MNKIDFTKQGGFPFDQDVLDFQQDNINTAMQPASLAGAFAILSGCNIVGVNAGNGYVVINGEVLPFEGGAIQAKVIIVETTTDLIYEDGFPRPSQIKRVARFGNNGVTNYLWANFRRNTSVGVLERIDNLESLPQRVTNLEGLPQRVTDLEVLPGKVTALEALVARVNILEWLQRPFLNSGGMVWWKGAIAAIPAGWQEVTEWRGRLPMPAKAPDPATGLRPAGFDIGNEAGAEGVKMTLANLIQHDHDQQLTRTDQTGPRLEVNHMDSGSGRGLFVQTIKTGKTGSADPTPMNVLNPYRVGCWIEPIPNFIP
jgi:hypothetical protein